ncbi:Ubiquitin-conjugating enzyme E2 6 [Umbelopsis sp. WA50703]
MASKAAYKRLTKEYLALQKSPPPFITARPLESNILEWHYVIRGPPDTPYHNGWYWGKLVFPSDYPFKPPSIRMSTPSGRFQTDTRLCLTMSDFHPSSWNPSWSVATILNGLLSFMVTDETTTGSIKTTDAEKRIYAARSQKFNLSSSKFRDIFPELCHAETLRPADTDSRSNGHLTQRRGRPSTNANPVALAAAQIVADTGATATTTVQQNKQSPFSQWRRWLLVLVVCVYLILTKISSRSNMDSSNTGSS